MTCQDAELGLAAYAVGALDDDEIAPLRRHLVECEACRVTASGFQRAAALLPLSVEMVDPPVALRGRILAQIHAEAGGGATAGRRARWWRRAWDRVPSGRGFTVAGAGGTALAAVAAALALTVARPTTALAPAPQAATPFSVHGCGLTAQPYACGSLTVTPSTHQAVLDVTGLEPIPLLDSHPTGVYEVWLITTDRAPQAAAFLTLQPDSRTWSAAMTMDPSGYVALAMTREPYPGGSPAPTGAEVLRLPLTAGSTTG